MWGKMYRYCAYHRLEDPSRKRGNKRLKRTKKRTEVVLGDRTYSWDQAWRNMKRAGVVVESQIRKLNRCYFLIIRAHTRLN